MKKILALPIIFLLINYQLYAYCDQADYNALKALYYQTDGDNWLERQGWDSFLVTAYDDPECNFYLAKVFSEQIFSQSENGNFYYNHLVRGISLSNIHGTFPNEINNLAHLKYLTIHNSQNLTGDLTSIVGGLPSSIESLALSTTGITGSIPSAILSLSNLVSLTLGRSPISGEIPIEIGQLISLENIFWYELDLEGSIPKEFASLSKLKSLTLRNCGLSNSIPTALGVLTNLEEIDLSYNNLTGQIPTSFGKLLNLRSLRLTNNNLSGEIPKELGNLSSVYNFYLDNNDLAGCLHSNLTKLCDIRIGTISINTGNPNLPSWDLFCSSNEGICPPEIKMAQLDSKYEYEVIHSLDKGDNPFMVAADGTLSSYFVIPLTELDGINNINLRIKEDPLNQDAKIYGKMEPISDLVLETLGITYKRFSYTAPSTPPISSDSPYDSYTIELIDIERNRVLMSYPLSIYRPPLLLIHGYNSNPDPFKKMQSNYNRKYGSGEILLVDYRTSSAKSFEENSSVVPTHINEKILQTIGKGIATSKVDIVAHSMGGLLTRQYLQGESYSNDINKLVTINTPHSGSPWGNIAFDPVFNGVRNLIFRTLFCEVFECEAGALNDFRVDGEGIMNLNSSNTSNSSFLNRNVVPSHAIASKAYVSNNVNSDFLTRKIVSPILEIFLFLDPFYNHAFGEIPNDLIVPLTSQKGGLIAGTTATIFENESHITVQTSDAVISYVDHLLGLDPINSAFSQNGFSPPVLTYDPLPPLFSIAKKLDDKSKSTDASMNVLFPLENSKYKINSDLNVKITGSGLSEISILVLVNEGLTYKFSDLTSNADFNIHIDSTYNAGDIKLIFIGTTNEGEPLVDTRIVKVQDCSGSIDPLSIIDQPYYQTYDYINSTAKVPLGYRVNLSGQKFIELSPGFETEALVNLKINIDDCQN